MVETDVVGVVETLAIERAKRNFPVLILTQWLHSGSQATVKAHGAGDQVTL